MQDVSDFHNFYPSKNLFSSERGKFSDSERQKFVAINRIYLLIANFMNLKLIFLCETNEFNVERKCMKTNVNENSQNRTKK